MIWLIAEAIVLNCFNLHSDFANYPPDLSYICIRAYILCAYICTRFHAECEMLLCVTFCLYVNICRRQWRKIKILRYLCTSHTTY